jgi:hypothetical protein
LLNARTSGKNAAPLNEHSVTWTWRSKYTPACTATLDPDQSPLVRGPLANCSGAPTSASPGAGPLIRRRRRPNRT